MWYITNTQGNRYAINVDRITHIELINDFCTVYFGDKDFLCLPAFCFEEITKNSGKDIYRNFKS